MENYCRLAPGQTWTDDVNGHRVGCVDAANASAVAALMDEDAAELAIQDPPYNFVAFESRADDTFIDWCREWMANTYSHLSANSSLYIWMGADQRRHFRPLPEFLLMMREFDLKSRSFITVRNQRGYGTQKNWMSVRQELLYYVKGDAKFNISAEYTDIPKILKGYYKRVDGRQTENLERSKSDSIRAGNVWVDIQQVFYRMEENVNGCYAQKPLKAVSRIIEASSEPNGVVLDLFSHSGSTLVAAEMLNRRAITADVDPVFAEITIRRLEHYRRTGRTGWQNGNPFQAEVGTDNELRQIIGVHPEPRDLWSI